MENQLKTKNKLHYIPSKYYSNTDWIIYARGYKNALINLIDSLILIKEITIKENELIFPILNLYRHFIELMLKQIIAEYNTYKKCKIIIPLTIHNLYNLWADCENNVKSILNDIVNKTIVSEKFVMIPELNNNDIDYIEEIIIQINDYDKNSDSFRYPIFKDGKQTLINEFERDLIDFKEEIHKVDEILDKKSSNFLFFINHESGIK